MGAGLLSFGLDEGMRSHLPEKRKIPINPVCERNYNTNGPIGIFLFSGRWASYPLWGVDSWGAFGQYWGVKIGTVFLKKLGSGLGLWSSR